MFARPCQGALLHSSSRRLQRKHSAILVGLLLGVIGIATWYFLFWLTPRTNGPLRQEVYVWQRAWTQSVREAVSQHATNFAQLVVLRAEVSWPTNRQPQLARANVDYETLTRLRQPVGLALRIGPYA